MNKNGSNSLADSKAGALIIEYPAALSITNPTFSKSLILASNPRNLSRI